MGKSGERSLHQVVSQTFQNIKSDYKPLKRANKRPKSDIVIVGKSLWLYKNNALPCMYITCCVQSLNLYSPRFFFVFLLRSAESSRCSRTGRGLRAGSRLCSAQLSLVHRAEGSHLPPGLIYRTRLTSQSEGTHTHTHCHSFMCFYASLLTLRTDTKRLNTPDFSVFSSLSICMRTPPTCAPWRTPCCSCMRASRRTRLQYWYRVFTL